MYKKNFWLPLGIQECKPICRLICPQFFHNIKMFDRPRYTQMDREKSSPQTGSFCMFRSMTM
eukprot:11419.XXX_222652_222837_1 [CDS] Oithona nana genome sequencing.